jgi:HAD superfamily hydrolase (TIGR01490 family)
MVKAAFFDVDGTLTRTRVWEGIMQYFARRNEKVWARQKFWAYHLPLVFLYRLGLLHQSSFRTPWARNLSWIFKGSSVAEMEQAWAWIAGEFMADYWRADTRALLDAHKAAGDVVFLVSAGPEPLLESFAKALGADHVVGTEHGIANGVFTGEAEGFACIDEYKRIKSLDKIKQLDLDIDLSASFAYADSPGDRYLLEMVGNPVATYPDEDLLPLAIEKGWRVFPEGWAGH